MKPILIYVAPSYGVSGVGDYANDFVKAITPFFSQVKQFRTAGPGRETLASCADLITKIRTFCHSAPIPTVLHAELSAGSLGPFWAMAFSQATVTSATVHDPPHLVWWPLRTRLLARSRWLTHGLHYPAQKLFWKLEKRAVRDTFLVALTEAGSSAVSTTTQRQVVHAPHYVPERSQIPSPEKRPRAVGLFGYAYGGKGFDLIPLLRDGLSKDIGLVVAGRGTDTLPHVSGVKILGEVNNKTEDAFFSEIRALLLPYTDASRYGTILSASGAANRAVAYRTPVVAYRIGAMAAEALTEVVTLIQPTPESAAIALESLISDNDKLAQMETRLGTIAQDRSIERVADIFHLLWQQQIDKNRLV